MKLFKYVFFAAMSYTAINSSAQAETMYIYKDSSGQTLLTNVDRPAGNLQKFSKQIGKKTYKSNRKNNGYNTYSNSKKYYNKANYGHSSKYGRSTYSNNNNRNRYDHLIINAANRYGVDPALVKAIIHTESNFKSNARSPVGAQGLMQLMPGTARSLKVSNPWNPAQNIDGGTRYIARLLKRFNNNAELALAGYNAGPNRQSLREGRIPRIRETQNYVKHVLSRYHSIYKHDPIMARSTVRTKPAGFRKASFSSSSNSSYSRTRKQNSGKSRRYAGNSRSSSIGTSQSYSQSAFDALR